MTKMREERKRQRSVMKERSKVKEGVRKKWGNQESGVRAVTKVDGTKGDGCGGTN